MPLLINREPVEQDSWQRLDEEALSGPVVAEGDIIVPLAFYAEHRDILATRQGRVAVEVTGDDDLSDLLDDVNRFALIAIRFPTLRDGRGFSIARLLKRAGFAGQIRATGDVTYDRLDYMTRCGFDALEIAAERYSDATTGAFAEFSVRYQSAEDGVPPIYRQ